MRLRGGQQQARTEGLAALLVRTRFARCPRLLAQALGTDAVTRSFQQSTTHVLLPSPDRLEVQPLLSNLEALAPRAADDAHLAGTSGSQLVRKINE